MEQKLSAAFLKEGIVLVRGHPFDPVEKHGFISSQRMGMNVFTTIHPDLRLVVAEAVWQYSHQMMARHKANHLNVVYAPTAEASDRALGVKSAMLNELGIAVSVCGDVQSQ